jgi:hypothetical protein
MIQDTKAFGLQSSQQATTNMVVDCAAGETEGDGGRTFADIEVEQ